jgi:hypothetical protein
VSTEFRGHPICSWRRLCPLSGDPRDDSILILEMNVLYVQQSPSTSETRIKSKIKNYHSILASSVNGSAKRFFASGFYHESSSPKPLQITQGNFEFFQKFAEIFPRPDAPPVSTTPVANLPAVLTTPVSNLPPE